MASDEQFSLCWNNFHANMSAGFHGLLSRGDLVDVTLAAEGRLLQAHKLVLSVCSPYFQEMFKMNPTQHPIVFLKDVSHSALRDLLQFMYQGEVNVKQEELASFISTAEQLQVKGLTGNQNEESSTPSKPKPTSRPGPRSSQQRQSVMTKIETDLDSKPSSTPVAVKRPNRPSIASNNSSSSQSGPAKRKCVDPLEAGPSGSAKEEFVTIPDEDENNAVAPKMEPEFVNESMWDDDEDGTNNDETNFGEDDSNMDMTGFDGSATGDGNISGTGEGGAVGDAQGLKPTGAVVGGQPAAAPEPDAAVVFVQKHGLSARIEGLKDDTLGYYSFYGIRYAEPPVGERRFQRPVRRLLAGEMTVQTACMPCPQRDPYNYNRVIGHEDCLCLNIYAPKMPGDEKGSPVIFFIHGGNYRSGSATAYGGQHLTQKDTILVTTQYRLGSLGYFSTAEKAASGNAGLFDLRAAMIWVKEYIEFFGGDPSRVVVMGQGSGGSAASLMALSNEGRSGTTGVAALSGAPLSPGAVRADPAKYAKELANKTDCPESPAERLINCLKKLPMEKIVLADQKMSMDNVDTKQFLDEVTGRSGAGARVEGSDDERALPPLVEESPAEALSQKRQKRIPMLTGVTSAETSRAVFGKYSQFLTNQLSSVKDFIKKEVVGGLRDAVVGVQGLVTTSADSVKQVLPLPDYYQGLFDSSLNAIDGLSQIAEATGDALFNFPAYESVRAWSAGSPAYLYSFEHVGNLTRGSHFLPGLALTSDPTDDKMAKAASKGPAHGDELAYIFEPLDDQGKPVGGEVSSTDARVRKNFVTMIAKFAHDLTPMESSNQSKNGLNLLPFSKSNEQFLKIGEDITLDKDFRFCQIGLWGNMADRVTGALCQDVLGKILKLPKLPSLPVNVPDTPIIPIPIDVFGMGSKKNTQPEIVQVTRKPSSGGGGLGGLLGKKSPLGLL